MTSLSEWLRAKDISDAEFGRLIGCDRGSVGRYTRGERYADPKTLVLIRRATAGKVMADDMLATWEAANPGRVPGLEAPVEEAGRRGDRAARIAEGAQGKTPNDRTAP